MKKAYWNPYLVGIGIGVLSWVVFVVVDKPIGISTAISQASGAVVAAAAGAEEVAANPYWAKNVPSWDYGTLFLVGTFLGALASSLAGKTFRFEWVPDVWRERFGESRLNRAVTAFLGGALILFGARMAGGCTSGHGISGTLQLAVSSWVFFVTMFVAGLVTAKLMFVKK